MANQLIYGQEKDNLNEENKVSEPLNHDFYADDNIDAPGDYSQGNPHKVLEEDKQYEMLENYKKDLSIEHKISQERSRSHISMLQNNAKTTQIESKMTSRVTPIQAFDSNIPQDDADGDGKHDLLPHQMPEDIKEDFDDEAEAKSSNKPKEEGMSVDDL